MNKSISFICPNCFSVIKKYERDKKDEEFYIVKCKDCGNNMRIHFMNALDTRLANTIASLNKKGYPTKFSCVGHKYGGGSDDAYIYFANYDDIDILYSNPLPDTWHKDDNCEKWNKFIIRSDYDNKNRVLDIYNWAQSLPPRKDAIFVYGYHYEGEVTRSVWNKEAAADRIRIVSSWR